MPQSRFDDAAFFLAVQRVARPSSWPSSRLPCTRLSQQTRSPMSLMKCVSPRNADPNSCRSLSTLFSETVETLPLHLYRRAERSRERHSTVIPVTDWYGFLTASLHGLIWCTICFRVRCRVMLASVRDKFMLACRNRIHCTAERFTVLNARLLPRKSRAADRRCRL